MWQEKGMKGKNRQGPKQAGHKYFLTLHRVKTEDLERSWRNQLGVCIALGLSIVQKPFLWIKIRNCPVEKDLLSEGRSPIWGKGKPSEGKTLPWRFHLVLVEVLRCSQGFCSSLSIKAHSSGIYFPPGLDSVPVPCMKQHKCGFISCLTTRYQFSALFFLKWIPALSSAGAEQHLPQFCILRAFMNDFCLASFHVLTAVCKV